MCRRLLVEVLSHFVVSAPAAAGDWRPKPSGRRLAFLRIAFEQIDSVFVCLDLIIDISLAELRTSSLASSPILGGRYFYAGICDISEGCWF